jgi:hypothetical protein
MKSTRKALLALIAATALMAACTAGDSSESGSDTTDGGGGSTPTTVLTGPSPGVTDDAIKIGVTFVDLESLGDIVNISHGDYPGSYQALFDAINESGGINGRTIDPVIVGINPVGTDSADAACVQLTEDEDAFLVMGFFLGDPTCPLVTHQTATIGGTISPELQEQAGRVPWFTVGSSTGFQVDIVRAMADAGELDGSLGVFAGPTEEAFMNDEVLPALDDLGIEVTESAVVDAPEDDITAINAAVATIAERFDSSGVDRVLILGDSGLTWASGVESTDYRPQLLLTSANSILAYATDAAGRDLSVLDGAVAGNLYGDAQNVWELPAMQDCIGTIQDAGVDVDEPDSFAPGAQETNYTAPFTVCREVALLQALLEAAGEDLNYGTLAAGAQGLEVESPIQPDPMVYGSGDAADGDPAPYLYDWDPDEVDFVPQDS